MRDRLSDGCEEVNEEKNNSKCLICHIQITDINNMPRVWRAAVSAKNNGFDVIVIGEGKDQFYEGIKYIGFNKSNNRLNRMLIRSRNMVRSAISYNPDIIEIHSPELLLYYRLIQRRGIKVIFNSHEFYGKQIMLKKYIPLFARRFVSFIYLGLEKHICRKIDCVFYPCTVGGKQLFEGRAKRSIKIENFSKTESFSKGDEIPRSLIYAGSLARDRGITTLVEVVNGLDCVLYLCGQFESKEYMDYINSISDMKKIRFLGLVSHEELMRLYGRVQIGVNILKKVGQYDHVDALGTKVYEYMQCGIPAVVTDFSYTKRVLEEYPFAIAVDPDDKDQVAGAITKLLESKELREKMGSEGIRAYKERFNWTVVESKMLSEYARLCYVQ